MVVPIFTEQKSATGPYFLQAVTSDRGKFPGQALCNVGTTIRAVRFPYLFPTIRPFLWMWL